MRAHEQELEEREARIKADEERQMRERLAWRQEHEQEVSLWRSEFARQQEEFFREQERRRLQQERQQASSSQARRRRRRSPRPSDEADE